MRARYVILFTTSLLVSIFKTQLSAQNPIKSGGEWETETIEKINDYTHSTKFKEKAILPYIKNEDVNTKQLNEFIDFVLFNLPSDERKEFFTVVNDELVNNKVNATYFQSFGSTLPAYILKYKAAKALNAKAALNDNVNPASTQKGLLTIPNDPCTNMDFNLKNYDGWEGSWGKYNGSDTATRNNPRLNTGFDNTLIDVTGNYAHTIMTKGADNIIPAIKCIPPSGGNAIRLGNSMIQNSGSTNGPYYYKAQRIRQTFMVTNANKFFSYQYAVVLQQPSSNHLKTDEPYFKIRMYDQNNTLINCATYNVIPSDAAKLNFQQQGDILYKNWSSVTIPLTAYMGQNVTVEFTTSDCTKGGHFGYAYISCVCPVKTFEVTPITCKQNGTLIAPSGFFSYDWTGPGIVKKIQANGIEVNQPGKYSVTLTTLASPPQAPCVITLDTVVTKLGGVTADFSFNEACFGQAVQFKNLSTPDSSSIVYEWDFNGDGTVDSKVKEPSYTYPVSGTYNVKLTVTDIYGCTATKTLILNQNPKITFKVTTSNPLCKQEQNSINVVVSGGSGTYTYKWLHGVTGTTNLTGVTTGAYKLYAKDTKGCSDSITVNYTAAPDPKVIANFSFTDACFGNVMSFTNKSTPNLTDNIYEWDFNADGTIDSKTVNATNTWPVAGTFKVKLITTLAQGCKHDTTISVTQDPRIIADFSFTKVCFGTAMPFVNKSMPNDVANTYAWDFNGDGTVEHTNTNPSYIWPKSGTFKVKLTATNTKGCKDDTTISVVQDPKVVADFSYTKVCSGTAMPFVNKSTPSLTDNTYAWDFNADGTVESTIANPSHIWPKAGTFNVKLTTTNAKGCKGDTVISVIQDATVKADFSFTTVCFGTAMPFINKSTPSAVDNKYAWDFNADGTVEHTIANPSYTWPKAGIFKVKLTTTNIKGCKSDTVISVTQDPKIIADFSFTKVCFGTAMPFVNRSTPSAVDNIYAWDFNADGTIESTIVNPSHLWPAQGSFSVRLTTTNIKGCKADTLLKVTQNPTIEIESSIINSKCGKKDASATVRVKGGSGNYPSVFWSNQKTGYTLNNMYDGTYTFYVKDSQNCSDSLKVIFEPDTNKLYTYIKSFKNVTCFDSCNGNADVGIIKGIPPYTYLWSTNPVIKEAYVSGLCGGTYTCTIVDKDGCTNATTVTISKPKKVTIAADPEQTICFDEKITLQGVVTGGTPAYNLTWKPTGPVVSPKVTTEYTITATDKNGCVAVPAKIKVIVGVPLKIQAVVAPDTICVGQKSTLTASATGGGQPYNFKWLNNGAIGAIQQVSPTSTTVYTVVLTDKCAIKSDTAKIRVVVNPLPIVKFTSNDTAGCATPLCIDFTNLTPNAKNAVWTFGDGTIKEVKTNFGLPLHHCYRDPGEYPVRLTITDQNGCTNTKLVNGMITVYELPRADFSFTPKTAPADQGMICFKDESINGFFIKWDFGDKNKDAANNHSDLRNPCHTYNDSGTYCIYQYVETDHGCRDTTKDCLIITPDWAIYVPNAFTPNQSGTNETFFAKARGIRMEKFSLRIFDRWGNFIFQSNNIDHGWDGRANGGNDIAQEDVYVWQITALDFQGRRHDLMGTVTLIK